MDEKKQLITEFTQKLLDLMGVSAQIQTEEKDGVFNVNLKTDEPGILIGYHGETLTSLQLILQMMTYKKLNEWVRIIVDIADYREKRKESLERMALSIAQKVKFSGQEQSLPPMSAFERRIIHIALSTDAEVETESQGEGADRRVIIKPKAK